LVYTGIPKNTEPKSCDLKKLIYIGESENDATRPDKNHENYKEWKKFLPHEYSLYFFFANVATTDRKRAEAVLIYQHKPAGNKTEL
jgi:hypothetical protein